MKAPRRWLDPESGASPELRRLIEAARPPAPMTEEQLALSRRKLERLVDRASLPMVWPWLGRGSLRPALVLAILLIAVLAAAAPLVQRLFAAAPAVHEPSGAPPASGSIGNAQAPRREPAPSPDPSAAASEPEAPRAEGPGAPPPGPRPQASSTTLDVSRPSRPEELSGAPDEVAPRAVAAEEKRLQEEVLLLDQARALRASDPGRALLLLSRHAQEHPRGKLSLDRELLAIEALRHAGRADEARSRANALLEGAKGRPYETKIRRVLEVQK